MSLGLVYFRRYRMEIDLRRREFSTKLPLGYYWVAWEQGLCDAHAATKYESFRNEIDAELFPCFAERDGCQRLMRTISERDGFLPSATWLVATGNADNPVYCGTVQGMRDGRGGGAVQNLGVIPGHRNQGLGTCLLFAALNGFRKAGLKIATLEVTAKNVDAVRLYERLGFRRVRSVYKTLDTALRT